MVQTLSTPGVGDEEASIVKFFCRNCILYLTKSFPSYELSGGERHRKLYNK